MKSFVLFGSNFALCWAYIYIRYTDIAIRVNSSENDLWSHIRIVNIIRNNSCDVPEIIRNRFIILGRSK